MRPKKTTNEQLTLNQFIATVRAFATNHYQINRFGTGPFKYIERDLGSSASYPYLWVVVESVQVRQATLLLRTRFTVLDSMREDDSNLQDVWSDTQQIVLDCFNYLKRQTEELDVEGFPTIIPVQEKLTEYVGGMEMTIDVAVDYDSSCNMPLSETPEFIDVGQPGFLTCESLPNCDTIIDLSSRIDAVEDDITDLQGSVTAIQISFASLETDLSALQTSVTAIDGRLTTAEGEIDTNTSGLIAVNLSITALDARVTALESGAGGIGGFTHKSVLFANSDGNVSEDNAGINFDSDNNYLSINSTSNSGYNLYVEGSTKSTSLRVSSGATEGLFVSDSGYSLFGSATRSDTGALVEVYGRVSQRIGTKLATAFGFQAGNGNSTGSGWTAVGYEAGRSSTSGWHWTAVGYRAGYSSTDDRWVAIGSESGYSNTSGNYWTAVGYKAARANTTGRYWAALGYYAGANNTAGWYWTALGTASGGNSTSGDNWLTVGFNAGLHYANGTEAASFADSVYVGAYTRVSAAGATNEIAVGYLAYARGSNTAVWGNTSMTDHYFTGNIGISNSGSNAARLHLIGAGSTSSTWSAQFHNSTGTSNSLMVRDDGKVMVGNNSITVAALNVLGGIYTQNVTGTNSAVYVGDGPGSGYPGIWFHTNASSPSYSNYSFLYDNATGTILNAPSTKGILFRVANSTVGMFASNGNLLLGTPSPSSAYGRLTVQGNGSTSATKAATFLNFSGDILSQIANDGSSEFRGSMHIGSIGYGTPLARLHLVGSGSTSATYAFWIQNSAPGDLFIVRDDGNVGIGTSTIDAKFVVQGSGDLMRLLNSSGSFGLRFNDSGVMTLGTSQASVSSMNEGTLISTISGAGLKFNTTFTGTGNSFYFLASDTNNNSGSAGNDGNFIIRKGLVRGSGPRNWTNLTVDGTINHTGGTGITRGIYVNQTITSAVDFRAIETSNNTGHSFFAAGTAPSYFGGKVTFATDIQTSDTGAFFLGDSDTDGTWKFVRSGSDLVIQRREGGSYVTKQTFTP